MCLKFKGCSRGLSVGSNISEDPSLDETNRGLPCCRTDLGALHALEKNLNLR